MGGFGSSEVETLVVPADEDVETLFFGGVEVLCCLYIVNDTLEMCSR